MLLVFCRQRRALESVVRGCRVRGLLSHHPAAGVAAAQVGRLTLFAERPLNHVHDFGQLALDGERRKRADGNFEGKIHGGAAVPQAPLLARWSD